ncbi:MAG: TonB-dependent receptor [Pseudomonadota bacterium]
MKTSFALLSAASVFALSAAMAGDIRGTVVADGGVPLRGAEVTVQDTGRKATTERDGSFSITGLPAGTYQLAVTYVGSPEQIMTVTVPSTGTVDADFRVSGDTVVVIGQRAAIDSALAQQRAADGIVTVLSADAIGQLPDENVAEAARRALGVSIANDQGEGRFISIRGINSQLNSTSVNGVRLTSPEANDRRVALDVIDADILKNITISKTLQADMDADAIGGAINLETVSGLDREDRLVKLKIGGIYENELDELGPEIAGTYIDNFMDGRLGLALSGNYQSREFASDNKEVDGSWDFDAAVPYPLEEIELRNYDIERERLNLSANIDYMLTQETRIYVNGIYNEFSDQEFRSRVEMKIEDTLGEDQNEELPGLSFDGTTAIYTPGIDYMFINDDGELEEATTELEFDRDIKDRLEEQTIFSIVGGFEHESGPWTIDGSLAYTSAEEEEPNRIDANFDQTFDEPGFAVGADTSNFITDYVFVDAAAEAAYLDASGYDLDNVEFTNGKTEDDELAITFNTQRDMEFFSNPGFLKSGVKVRLREKSYDLDFEAYDHDGDATLADFETSVDFPLDLFGPAPSASAVRSFFNANRNDSDVFVFDEVGSLEESGVSSFDAEEDVYAGYVMGQVDIDDLRITAGVRVEHTEIEATGNVFNEGTEALSSVPFDDSYTDVLGSIAARWAVREDTNIRASYYGSIVRPNFGQFVPAGTTNDDGELEAGNPELERTKAHNFDLLAEYYPSASSVLQAGVFYKTIDNFIAAGFTENPGVFNDLSAPGGFNTFINLDDGYIFGVELGYQQALDFLPYGLDGLLVGANYTYADSEAELEDGTEVQIPGQSEHIFNALLGYEKGRVNLRAAYSFKAENIDDVSVDGFSDGRVVQDQSFLDFSAKFEVYPGTRVYFDAKNILDTELRVSDRSNGVDRLNQFEDYGQTFQFGVQFTY